MSHTLTIHKITPVPYSNLNRDDQGMPKRIKQGGVLRAMHSSQSIKRAIRTDFEENSMRIRPTTAERQADGSVRSAHLAELVCNRAMEINSELSQSDALKAAKKLVGALTKGAESTEGEAGRSTWLSREELEIAAMTCAEGSESDFIDGNKTGSLAIAAFGRMFAAQQNFNTEAAISVSPAISTHTAVIETDYFTTVDDSPSEKQQSGATFLGISAYTSATMYQSLTIDKAQLKESWTGFGDDSTRDLLTAMVKAMIYKLPRGKAHGTAPYSYPLVVLAEEQNYRMAYDFETPVAPGEEGGFGSTSIKRLSEQRTAAQKFDRANFGELQVVAGTASDDELASFDTPVADLNEFISKIVNWILADA